MSQDDFMARVLAHHLSLQDEIRATPSEGMNVEYAGREFRVFPGVFIPHEDSLPLAENLCVRPGDTVLDVFTGSGVIAILSAYAGASSVVAVDINPAATRCSRFNAKMHGFAHLIDVRVSDVFSAVSSGEQFDVITANPPFLPHPASDFVTGSFWDTELRAHRHFFKGLPYHLRRGGRAYISQANFGPLESVRHLAADAGFFMRQIAQTLLAQEPDITFYAFQLAERA